MSEINLPIQLKSYRAGIPERPLPRVLCPLIEYLQQADRSFADIVHFLKLPEQDCERLIEKLQELRCMEESLDLVDFSAWVTEQEPQGVEAEPSTKLDFGSEDAELLLPPTFCEVSQHESSDVYCDIC